MKKKIPILIILLPLVSPGQGKAKVNVVYGKIDVEYIVIESKRLKN